MRLPALVLLFVLATQPAAAQFHIPALPNIPSVPGLQNAAIDRVLAQFANSVLPDIPVVSSANAVYATVASLPGPGFAGRAVDLTRSIDPRSGTAALAAGDYTVSVDVFCMKATAHSPSGRRYIMAPLRGAAADIITALNARAATSGVEHARLQMLSWEIQAGMPYAELPPEQRGIIDRVLPEFRSRLQGNPLAALQARYQSSVGAVPGAPSFDSALARMGDAGRAILALRDTHDRLVALGSDPNAVMRGLVAQGGGGGQAGGNATPWSLVSPRVYERLTTDGNYSTPATLQIRVMPGAAARVAARSLAGLGPIADAPAPVPLTNTVGDPGDGGIQPLTSAPRPGGETPPAPRPTPTRKRVDPPHPPHSPRVPTTEHGIPVDGCASAAAYLSSHPDDVGVAHANLKPSISPNPPVAVKQSDGTYAAKAALNWALDPATSSIVMPYFSWPDMTEAEAAALGQYYAELLNHEEGHITVAIEYGKSISTPITGHGATAAAAVADFTALVKSRAAKNASDIAARDADYDNAVNHGANQTEGPGYGFPGGPNVVLECP